jgi:hypothetical protein
MAGQPQLKIVTRLAAIDKDRADEISEREFFWSQARKKLGKLRRLNPRDIWQIETMLAKRIAKPLSSEIRGHPATVRPSENPVTELQIREFISSSIEMMSDLRDFMHELEAFGIGEVERLTGQNLRSQISPKRAERPFRPRHRSRAQRAPLMRLSDPTATQTPGEVLTASPAFQRISC